jgi:hypothetical protein
VDMAESAKQKTKDEIVQEVFQELEARRGTLTIDELFDLIRRIPRNPNLGSSADIIRELRGPLPADDPEYQKNFGHR